MLRKLASLFLLLLDERADCCDVGVKDGPELLAADHLDKGLLVCLRHLRRLLQVLEVFLLTVQVVT